MKTNAAVCFGGTEVFFCKNDQGSPATWISLMVDDVDAYYEQIKYTGAKILHQPDTKPWSMREILVECPDGHIFRIGHNTNCD